MPRDYTLKKPLPQTRYGRLSVIANAKGGWLCRCDCGTEKVIRTQGLKSGAAQSCGCSLQLIRNRPTKHGMSKTSSYRLWVSMMDRCSRPSVPNFSYYGGRGIKVCERWQTFENFHADMGERPEGMTLDRIDTNGNYEPSNCRWASHQQQGANRRNNRMLTLNGVTKPLPLWCSELGLNPVTVSGRLRRGASPEAALQPVSPTKRAAIRISRAV